MMLNLLRGYINGLLPEEFDQLCEEAYKVQQAMAEYLYGAKQTFFYFSATSALLKDLPQLLCLTADLFEDTNLVVQNIELTHNIVMQEIMLRRYRDMWETSSVSVGNPWPVQLDRGIKPFVKTESAPPLPENHPLLSFIDIVGRDIADSRGAWLKQYG